MMNGNSVSSTPLFATDRGRATLESVARDPQMAEPVREKAMSKLAELYPDENTVGILEELALNGNLPAVRAIAKIETHEATVSLIGLLFAPNAQVGGLAMAYLLDRTRDNVTLKRLLWYLVEQVVPHLVWVFLARLPREESDAPRVVPFLLHPHEGVRIAAATWLHDAIKNNLITTSSIAQQVADKIRETLPHLSPHPRWLRGEIESLLVSVMRPA